MTENEMAIIVALIGAGTSLIVALIGKISFDSISSNFFRKNNNIPDITGSVWEDQWCLENGDLFAEGTVTFEKWKKASQFEGFGEVIHEGTQYKYPISGEVSPSRIVTLTYKAENFPTEGNIGMACLQLSNSARKLEGLWAGRNSQVLPTGQEAYVVRGGSVVMRKIKDLK